MPGTTLLAAAISIMCGVFASCLGLGLSVAQADDDDDWVGFYVGIDALDGSIDRMSISPNGDGTYILRIRPSTNSHCKTETQEGIVTATGKIIGGKLVRQEVRVKCFGGEEFSLPDSTYMRDGDNGILKLTSPDDGRTLIYHRISGGD